MAQRGTDPDLGHSEEGQFEDYLPRLAWDDDLTIQGPFNSIHPLSPAQGPEPLPNHFAWQGPTQPQISTHSAPQRLLLTSDLITAVPLLSLAI